MMKKIILLITALAVLAVIPLAFAACGSGSSTTTTAASSTTTIASTTTTSGSTTTSMGASTTIAGSTTKDIIDTAIAAGDFKTLATLLTTAGLVNTLKGVGPYTVFAPTDEAFAKVSKTTLAKLATNPSNLKKVLLYHVVKGKITAANVTNGEKVKTLEGDSLTFAVNGNKVTVNGANIVKSDIVSSNGVINVIDQVLLPPGISQ